MAVNNWNALTVGVCNQSYYRQIIARGWTPDFSPNRSVLWTWRRMLDRTRIEWKSFHSK